MSFRARLRSSGVLTGALGAVWIAAVCAGLVFMQSYASRPGLAATPPGRWPRVSRLERARDRPTLVMLLHPGCPCSRASVEELDRVLAHAPRVPAVHLVFFRPREVPDGWERTDLWQRAAAIPGVRLWRDDDGVEATRFGAATSGQVLLYDTSGALVFSGGITPSRGHEGDNAGRDTVVALLAGQHAGTGRTPVFGCSLRDPDRAPADPPVTDGL